jgi:putative glutamine amidotransferase
MIGITPESVTLSRADGRGAFCGHSYTIAVELAGGVPLILPLTSDLETLEQFLSLCDGFLLSGGGDFAETGSVYGRQLTEAEHQSLSGVDPVRDEMELYLMRRFVEEERPVLGICRGLQVMNVALGGTLLPDIPGHRGVTHEIEWKRPVPGCRQVNSTHHQAVGRLTPSLNVLAVAADGVVEAVEKPGAGFCVGVQFHPERLLENEPAFLWLFEGLVAAAQR